MSEEMFEQERLDRFGITEVFATHLEISLANMHPEQAILAACAAVQQYGKSYDWIPMSHKASERFDYQMRVKKPGGGGEMR